MAPQSRGRAAKIQGFHHPSESTSDEATLRALPGSSNPLLSSASVDGDVDEEEDDADFQSHYSLDARSSSGGSSDSGSDIGDDPGKQRPFLHHSNNSFPISNAFAPPFYNRPPTPLPPSPSLTSLLRPSFSTNTSRPTTPDSSDNDTPNDTEAAVAKSARTATTVPRASPKVPTYEYYGFVLYLLSSLGFRTLLPTPPFQGPESDQSSHVSALVLPPITLSTSVGHILLPGSMVVLGYPFLPCDEPCLHLRGACLLQYWILNSANE